MRDLVRAAPFVRMHRQKTFVIKVGGHALARRAAIRAVADQVAVVHALGARVVLVHGGGPQTDVLQRALGEEPRKVDGRRVTTRSAMRALSMATAGELHLAIVAELVAAGAPAVGVSGASDGLLVARRRPPMETSQGVVDFGEVGDLHGCDPAALGALLDVDRIPIVSPPAADGNGRLLNVNADIAAATLAGGLGASKLIFLTSASGVLGDPDDPASLHSTLSLPELDELESGGHLADGMHVKAAAIRKALELGVERVHVVSGIEPAALLTELYTTQGAGTLVTREPEEAPTEVPAVGAWT